MQHSQDCITRKVGKPSNAKRPEECAWTEYLDFPVLAYQNNVEGKSWHGSDSCGIIFGPVALGTESREQANRTLVLVL